MGRLTTNLGGNRLALIEFNGQEQVNDLFTYRVECLALNNDGFHFDDLIGTVVTAAIEHRTGTRHYNGLVVEASWLGASVTGHRYQLLLRPWLYLATLRRNQRIFHRLTAPEILTQLLSDYASLGSIENRLHGSFPKLEYTVQFRESDFDFASRLMQRFGISYHFVHEDGAHKMVLTDVIANHASIGNREFHPDQGIHQEDKGHFWLWQPRRRMTTGAVRLTDYNFKTPAAAMEVDREGGARHAQGKIESFDWPGGFESQDEGRTAAERRSNAQRGQAGRFYGEGSMPELGAGCRVGLTGDAVPGSGREYLCLSAHHYYGRDNYGSGGGGGDSLPFRGRYVLLSESAPLAPEMKTQGPPILGPQTATVTGTGEVDVDEFGRILVKFHWDLSNAVSMRCRVSQAWAGAGWGGMVIPRVGMEVVVDFLDGDPDRPLVTGCVYNGKNPVPYALPDHKTRSTFRSNSHEGKGFNELRFEDQSGKEEIWLHAQFDQNEKVRNHHSQRVDRNQLLSIGENRALQVAKNQLSAVGGDYQLTIGTEARFKLVSDGAAKRDEGLGGLGDDVAKAIGDGGGHYVLKVSGDHSADIKGNLSEEIGLGRKTKVGIGWEVDVGTELTLKAGSKIVLQVGASELSLDAMGNVSLKGVKGEVKMGAMLEMLAALIKLN